MKLSHNDTFLFLVEELELPFRLYGHEMVTSIDKTELYIVGGWNYETWQYSKEIYQLTDCTGAIETCKWKKINTELKYGRYYHSAVAISDAMAAALCA